jgi:CubicO group peptidase (beta-lactamase class C family)
MPTPTLAADPASAGLSAPHLERLTDVLRADVEAGAIPGAVVLIARDGNVAYHEALGYADRKTSTPMQLGSIFRIASMTKPITAVAALMLMERGKLVLSDPVSRYLPELAQVKVGVETVGADGQRSLALEPVRRPMTVHDLLRHTAGFTYGQFGDSLVQRAYRAARMIDNQQTNADMVTKLAQLPLAHQPGTTFEYGMSTDVLGRVIEVVAGMTLDRVFAELITRPLGMRDTAFGVEAGEVHRLAEPHRESSATHIPAVVPYDPATPANWFSGGGGQRCRPPPITHDSRSSC